MAGDRCHYCRKIAAYRSLEEESGILTTKQVLFASGSLAENAIDRVAVKPSISFGVWSSGRYSLSVFIRSVSESRASVKITTHFEAFEVNMTKSWHVCYSKGIVESSTWESIKSKVPVQMPDGTKLRIF